ncbi:hypothetical protein EW146_g9241 [Bondarzewia mesenterica]|uniref:Retroviral polymerase SH3-like domain-containing protein n=1 Tax=Bondarzewia mesenterica TaxID=1095465 RepID=A0A4S4L862_9AGAM|nr:hypothetical protein EW146_g9241 [Bondarzewia mesenterica]
MVKVRAMLHASGLSRFLWREAAHHAVWLKNRTATKAVNGMMPFEAVTGQKPNLRSVREWGSTVWVHDTTGLKLEPRAKEGHWIGVDELSKGCRVYWPKSKMVSVERNVYYVLPSQRLEGEVIGDFSLSPDTSNEMPATSTRPKNETPASSTHSNSTDESALSKLKLAPTPAKPAASTIPLAIPINDSPNIPEECPKWLHKPSMYVRALQSGKGVASTCASDPVIPRGLQVPGGWEGEEADGKDGGGVADESGEDRAEVEEALVLDEEEDG